MLNGKWSFASGVDHASWIRLGAFIKSPDAAPSSDGAFFLLPTGEVEIEDNWFVYGLCGTGSKNIIVHDAFVPEHRVLRFADTRAGRTSGAEHHRNPLYRLPLLVLGASMLASTAVGAAKGAVADYLEMTTGRKTRGALAGGGLPMAEFATVQLRFAEASAAAEAAELILMTNLRNAMAKLRAGEEITVADRIRARRDQAYATKLALQAVEALNASTGGAGLCSAIRSSAPGATSMPSPAMSASIGMRSARCTVSTPSASNPAVNIKPPSARTRPAEPLAALAARSAQSGVEASACPPTSRTIHC